MTLLRRTLLNALAASGRSVSSSNSIVIPPPGVMVKEITLPCSDGTVLAAQKFVGSTVAANCNSQDDTTTNNKTILCIHGWMDNCRSFHYLAPALAARTSQHVIALDLVGHGMSSHKSKDSPPMVQAEFAFYVSEAIEALGISENTDTTLIGHSLGAGISSLYAAAFPEQISKLVLLDGAGFLARDPKDSALHVRKHIETRQKKNQQSDQDPRMYPSIERAIKTRQFAASKMPGNQYISYEAAKELVKRGTVKLEEDGMIHFRHDSRYAWPSIQYMTWPQSEGIFKVIEADTCLLIAEDGYPFKPDHMEQATGLLQPKLMRTLSGSHYFHADPETADTVVDSIMKFLTDDDEDKD